MYDRPFDAATFVLAILFAMPALSRAAERPNVIFILADDLGYRETGSFGQQLIKTRNLDRLANEGLKLTQHYCGNAVCAPSRCVLLTGKHPGHAFVRNNKSTPRGLIDSSIKITRSVNTVSENSRCLSLDVCWCWPPQFCRRFP